MSTNFLYAQAPNRKGNIDKQPPSKTGGVTNVTGAKHGTATPKGSQGAPSVGGDAVCGRHQKVAVSKPKESYGNNDGYRSSSFLK
jgi:hypothetical protein